ncbi:maleylpyruvate isomerase family mycothiol-dependent enzyme [Streptomyces sp. NPDC005551]|uniref:maleylpyruvate isomerase family mycothiol-dependent enzyme n=1 Tax=Streptomyces sp. NPDC005551 TaxID=3364725 RepID=UPI0036967F24
MKITEFLETLDHEGRLLASAAAEAGVEAAVPTCPGWQVRDLLRHTGMVHRWAAAFVADGHTSYQRDGGLPDLDGGELLAWFREGHRRLVDTLAAAPSDIQCWSFLPAPSPLAFWARRQAHETTVHRVDAESALGGEPTAIATAFAVDGIDELLRGFHARPKSGVRSEAPRVLRVRAIGTADLAEATGGADAVEAVWTVRLSAEPPAGEPGEDGDADCELAGPADQLYLALWNRRPFPSVAGDAGLADLWREKSAVTWN